MAKPPHNEHELELALTRLAGSNVAAVEYRDLMSGVVLGQMLPEGSVVKGGTSMRLRLGPGNSRVTVDFDAARRMELDAYVMALREKLSSGWCGFTGEVLVRKAASPIGVPAQYVMQPLDVKLAYRNHPWCTVRLEVSHNELGDADEVELRELPKRIKDVFASLNFPEPGPIPLMTIPFQIAQKLHGLSQPGSTRVRDLVDLQLIIANETVDWVRTAGVCRKLFAYRKTHLWPAKVTGSEEWQAIYDSQRGSLPVVPTCDEAVSWANNLIRQIDSH